MMGWSKLMLGKLSVFIFKQVLDFNFWTVHFKSVKSVFIKNALLLFLSVACSSLLT